MTVINEQGQPPDSPGEFFIPDLCATRPVLIMVILAELLVLVYVLGDSELPDFAWSELALASLFVQWTTLLCAAALCASRQLLSRLSLAWGVCVSFVFILAVTLASSLVAMVVVGGSLDANMDMWWLLRNQLVAIVIAGIALRYFYLQQQLRAQERAELNARIDSLRSRIRPHFLFNTMNSIASLIGSRPLEAEQAVEDLSELFRASLMEGNDNTTLADELHLCKLYLRVEQLRLGERMHVRWDIDESLLACPMPALLLQPLVENAVYHGLAHLPEGGEIRITLSGDGDKVRVAVTNPVPPAGGYSGSGHHIALDNIRQRLEAHYGAEAWLDVRPGDADYAVELVMPMQRSMAGEL